MLVVTDTRDLGAHLNTLEHRQRGTTLSKRMQETAEDVKKLKYTNAPYEMKEKAAVG